MQKTKLWHDAKRDHFYDGDIDRFKEFVPSLLHPTLSGRDASVSINALDLK